MLGFLTPWLLAGLGALAAPILVHLVQKERKNAVPFPSLMFLAHMPHQSARRQRIRHWFLFLLRCLAVALLVMAFARPFIPARHASAALLPRSGRDIVIALDRSYSMAYGDRWRRAIVAAKDVVGRMRAADRATVVAFAGTASSLSAFTHDKAALLAVIDSMQPTAGVTRYDAAFRLAQHLLSDTAQPQREMVLISDYHRAGWGGRELPRLPVGTTFTQVNLGSSTTADVAVAHVDVQYDTTVGREHATVSARLVNHGDRPLTKHPVTFELNGRPMQTRLADCPANGVVNVAFDPVVTPPGLSRGIVRAGADSLEPDNRFYFLVTHKPSLPILVVEPSDAPAAGAFLSRALNINDRLHFRVKTVRADRFSVADLRSAALVILNGAQVPGGELGQRLTAYVKDGGGLLLILGSQSHPNTWPAIADELLPRPAAATVSRDADRAATLEFIDRAHPVFDAFNTPHSGDFSAARFLRYWTLKAEPDDRQLARFDDGRIALLERRVGAGRVLVWSSDLDGVWNDLPLQPVFLPLLHQAVKYTAGYEEEHRWMTVGDILSLPTVFGENSHRTDSQTADADYVAIAPAGGQTRFARNLSNVPTSLELAEQGFYDIRRTGGAGDSASAVAVNVDLAESDLTPLDTTLLAAAVSPPAVTAEHTTVAGASMPSDLEQRQRLWWYLLVLALMLLGAETLVSNRLSRTAH